MRILVTNDDGVHAHGITVLAQRLSEIAEVCVVAPLHNHSGAGHGLTITTPLRAHELSLANENISCWAVEGTPADCVKLGMEKLVPVRPDIIVSGINDGPNLGTDVIYSGTVAAAMEGYFHGCPAIAVSVSSSKRHSQIGNYDLAADVVADYCAKLSSGEIPRTLLNINVPGDHPADVKGVRNVPLGWRWYDEAYNKRIDPSGRPYYWIQGSVVDGQKDGSTDVEVCAAGYITVTPLDYDMTNYQLLTQLP